MTSQNYNKQVTLLLDVLPVVAKEECFAMHGGTAINLFIRNMPRLSVDIDLTYIPIESREDSHENINNSLNNIKISLEKIYHKIIIYHKPVIGKLLISHHGIQIKIEVNLVNRGCLHPATKLTLCEKASEKYDSFTAMKIVDIGQLYGGKISAALDRQHPRDLFDAKYLLSNEGITKNIKEGFMYCLSGSSRPIHEILSPNLLDQKDLMVKHFDGMTEEIFTYQDFEKTRNKLIKNIHTLITKDDQYYLLNLLKLQPDFNIYNFSEYPAIKWKLLNLEKLKSANHKKYQEQIDALELFFDKLS